MLTGCSKSTPHAQPQPTAKLDAAADAAAEARDQVAAKPVARQFGSFADVGPIAHQQGEIFGHLLVRNPARFLEAFRNTTLSGPQRRLLELPTTRALLASSLRRRGNLAFGLNFDAPVACVLASPQESAFAYACIFGYNNDSERLIKDLGATAIPAGGAGEIPTHLAKFDSDGDTFYLDTLDKFAIVSVGERTWQRTSKYMQQTVIPRTDNLYGDVEVVAYTGDLIEHYDEPFNAIVETAGSEFNLTKPHDHAAIPEAFHERWRDYRKEATQLHLRRLTEFEEVHLHVMVDDAGLRLGTVAIPKIGTSAHETTRRDALEAAPRKATHYEVGPSIATVAMEFHATRLLEDPGYRSLIDASIDSWSILNERPAQEGQDALTTFLASIDAVYEPDIAISWHDEEVGPLSFSVNMKIKPTASQSARPHFLSLAKLLQKNQLFGSYSREFGEFEADTQPVKLASGQLVDRLRFRLGRWPRRALERRIGRKWIDRWEKKHGPLTIVVDRLQSENDVRWTISLTPQTDLLTRTTDLALAQAEANQTEPSQPESKQFDQGLAQIYRLHPQASSALGIRVDSMVKWLANRWPEQFAPLSRKLHEGSLTDIVITSQSHRDGRASGQVVLSPGFFAALNPDDRRNAVTTERESSASQASH